MRASGRRSTLREHDLPTRGGRTLAYVYDSGLAEADALGPRSVAVRATNGLDPTAFPSLLQMEQDLVATAADLLDGPAGPRSAVTSGGTESILLAVQTARDAHPESRPRAWCCRSPRMPRSTRRPATSASGRCWCRSMPDRPGRAAAMAAAIDRRHGAGGRSARRTPTAWSTRSPEIASPPLRAACAATSTPASAAGCCPTCAASTRFPPLRSGAGRDQHQRWTCTSTPTRPRARRCCCTALPSSAGRSSSPVPAGPATPMLNSTLQSTKSGGPLAAAWAVTRFIGDNGYCRTRRAGARRDGPVAGGALRGADAARRRASRTRRWSH